ncbi:Wzz/FepE/Etk N-terminal domain-containing protein [Mucilaginibacter panaciglaebae]|uniref:Polysaccharide chain length determinant N-terminal domain-containing protein n=1 Tax=Mucilaginibacter panaciglaebae TaxID=502331 RepID=A0ABP7WPA2_9SPHI
MNRKGYLKDSDEMTLKELIHQIWEIGKYIFFKWRSFLMIGILGAVVGFAYARFKRPTYTATTTFVLEAVDGSRAGLGQYAGLASMAGIDVGGSSGGLFQEDNIIELYKSRKMLEKTLYSHLLEDSTQLLIDRYLSFNDWRKKWVENPELKKIDLKNVINADVADPHLLRLRDSLVSVIVNDIDKNYLTANKLDKKLSIIKVDVKSPDELFSKDFNDQLVKNVNDFYVQTKTKKSLQSVAILQHQTDSVRNILNGAINNVANINDATPNLNPVRQILRAPAQHYQLNIEANKAILSELVKNLELSKMNLRQETPLIQIIDKPVYPLLKDKLSKLRGIVFGFVAGAGIAIFFLAFTFIFKKKLNE